ncbi:dephospho-CoA kinase [Paenibacillus bovis]|uniref:Dephospho-CoA kinase n=1 Tax=Paenibacillus bovis TaxID=1616788 RepID=A0A172ZF64_9BACL|nr:dephospho-CoA kinase [Paenibacillus bovis]ANF96291.1 dephospho-CoA kinase [Paenibacillus bovis]
MNIGLTGGIATGKSTVSAWLVQHGAALVDADLIAREIMMPGHPVLQQVRERFGAHMLNEDGTLNRKQLGEHIFTHPEERQALEGITHPAIRALIHSRVAELEAADPQRLVIADIPLLLEARDAYRFDEIMVVYVPREIQLQRLMQRDGLTAEQAEKRLAAQMDIEEKKRIADIVIDNSGTPEQTQQQLQQFWESKRLV